MKSKSQNETNVKCPYCGNVVEYLADNEKPNSPKSIVIRCHSKYSDEDGCGEEFVATYHYELKSKARKIEH